MPRDLTFDNVEQLANIYDPTKLGLEGRIQGVFPGSSVSDDKVYFVDQKYDPSGVLSYVTLEVSLIG